MDSHRPGVTDFVHIGLVVEDLEETVRFLAVLGFDCGEPGVFSGEWIDRIIGLENATVETVMARTPDGKPSWAPARRVQSRRRAWRRRPRPRGRLGNGRGDRRLPETRSSSATSAGPKA